MGTRGIATDEQLPTLADPAVAAGRSRREIVVTTRRLARNRMAMAGAIVYLTIALMALLAPVIAPHDPGAQQLLNRLKPPAMMDGGSTQHLLGTDNLGRDILSRLIYGARVSIVVGLVTVTICAMFGSLLGAIGGYLGGRIDYLLVLLLDIWMAFPFLVLAIAMSAVLGPGPMNLILALVLSGWVGYCRVVRGEVMSLRERDFIVAARVVGVSDSRIIARHLVPNVLGPILVLAMLEMATVIIAEAALSFLGLGVGSGIPTWGAMLNDGRAYLRQAWWLATFPGVIISVLVLSINFFGDGLRDALDPRLRNR